MKKTDNIEEIFNECLESITGGRSTVAECLIRHPEHAVELEGLLATSTAISKAAEIDPPPGARMRIRVALNQRMAALSRSKIKPLPFWRFGWANSIATFILGLSLAGGGVAYAASGAMPGQALYPLKLDLEQALVSLTFSSSAKVELYAALNDRRVGEIVYLAQKGDSQGIAEVTSRIENNLSAAASAKGISSSDYATAKAAAPPINTQNTLGPGNTVTTPTTPATTLPDTGVPPAILPSKTTPPAGFQPGQAITLTIPKAGSTVDSVLRDHANNQLSSLAGAVNASNSLAVQAALDRAIAAIINGNDALISQP
jgi:hypothetical protein